MLSGWVNVTCTVDCIGLGGVGGVWLGAKVPKSFMLSTAPDKISKKVPAYIGNPKKNPGVIHRPEKNQFKPKFQTPKNPLDPLLPPPSPYGHANLWLGPLLV